MIDPSIAAHPSPQALYRRVTWRLVPLLFVGYVAAYLDRVNVGFAKLQMLADLKFSDTIYGFGAGIFFIGYFLFEVPSNLALHRFGARVWIARIMILWALISAATMFVRTPGQFYFARFMLGAAEAGFFPGIIFYLTCWYPAKWRAQITAYFVSAIGLSGIVGGPLSGWIMQEFSGRSGLAGWQWLFLIEAVPSLLMGFVVLRWLPAGIEQAVWLSVDEKRQLRAALEAEPGNQHQLRLGAVLSHGRVWGLGAIYFMLMIGLYGISFWTPQLVRNAGFQTMLGVGLVSAVPYLVAVAGMVMISHRSDRTGRRQAPLLACFVAGALGFALIALANRNMVWVMTGLTLATTGVLGAMPLFWTFPATFLGGAAAAAGIALINSLGNLGGFASPYLVGMLNDLTHATNSGLHAMAACLLVGAGLVRALLFRNQD